MLISAKKNTSLHLVCLYDGNTNDLVYRLLKEFNVEIILHQLPYKQELMEIYPREWMLQNLGKEIEYNRIFGTFMRMEIPVVEKEEKYVLYSDIDVIFNSDILLEELPHPTYLAAAPEYERNVEDMEYFNAGVLVMNIQGMKEKYEEFILKMKNRERNISGLFDQGYLNELCFKDMELLPIEYNWKPYWGINDKAKLIHFHGMKPSSNLNEAGFITDNSFSVSFSRQILAAMQDMYTILPNSMIIWEEKKTNGYTITYKKFSIYIKIHLFSFLNITSISLNTRNIRNTI
ncbi:glycosyltransferase [Bacteroides sp. CR5/BHMF/2]|nr:glycosyltransferase [Bacteroides sp. CR5/BHMF/2]